MVCLYLLFLPGSVLEGCTFLRICAFLPGCPMCWHIVTCESESRSVVSSSLQPHGLYSSWNSEGQNTGVGKLFPPPGDLPNPGVKARSPALQADSLSAEPHRKPKHTGVGSLSHLQGMFPTQESNRNLLHCRRILHQLSYQGSISLMSLNSILGSLNFTLRTVGNYRRV